MMRKGLLGPAMQAMRVRCCDVFFFRSVSGTAKSRCFGRVRKQPSWTGQAMRVRCCDVFFFGLSLELQKSSVLDVMEESKLDQKPD